MLWSVGFYPQQSKMFINMSPCGSTLEEQLSSIMDALAKAAVSEIGQLFSEGSATLRLQITRSLKENEALRTRMKVMRRELLSLRFQAKSYETRAASRLAPTQAHICRPRTEPLGNGEWSSGCNRWKTGPRVQGALLVVMLCYTML